MRIYYIEGKQGADWGLDQPENVIGGRVNGAQGYFLCSFLKDTPLSHFSADFVTTVIVISVALPSPCTTGVWEHTIITIHNLFFRACALETL